MGGGRDKRRKMLICCTRTRWRPVEESRGRWEPASAAPPSTPTPKPPRRRQVDDLTLIKGIGPKFAETLNAAGITSYAELANTPAEKLEEIVQPAAWQKVDFEEWIAQSSALSRQSRRMQIGDDLTRLEGIGPTYAQKLRAAGITSFAQLATPATKRASPASSKRRHSAASTTPPGLSRPSWPPPVTTPVCRNCRTSSRPNGRQHRPDPGHWRYDVGGPQRGRHHNLCAACGRHAGANWARSCPQPVCAAATSTHGSRRQSSAPRASVSPTAVRRTRAVPEGASINTCPQDLGRIEGIGETYEQRLYAVGIGTFWEVGMLSQGGPDRNPGGEGVPGRRPGRNTVVRPQPGARDRQHGSCVGRYRTGRFRDVAGHRRGLRATVVRCRHLHLRSAGAAHRGTPGGDLPDASELRAELHPLAGVRAGDE